MGYQALLFCPEEKLARIVSQVFNELDFTIEPVNEPFAAVKKLMAQRYDAIVVDCDNEQNTALLFKSARNSTLNQGSLAIALVEGQAGVAKAYRIGANLVLTKPINVEQTKGTLRVARGLLRKGAEGGTAAASGAAAGVKVAPVAAKPATPPVATPQTSVAVAPKSSVSVDEVRVALPAIAASAKPEEKPVIAAMPVAQTSAPVVEEQPARTFSAMAPTESDRRKEERVSPAIPAHRSVVSPSFQSAAAPAPAKEIDPAPEKTATPPEKVAPAPVREAVKEEEAALPKISPAPLERRTSVSSGTSDGPTFAALGVEDTTASGGSKKILIGVVALITLVALAYFGWTQFGQPHGSTTPQKPMPAASEPAPQNNTSPQLAPMSSPAPAPTTTVERASASPTEHAPKSSATQANKASVSDEPQQITLNSEPEVKKETPIRVKPAAPSTKPQPQTEEAAAQLPNPLGVNSSDATSLSGILSAPTGSKPTLARIKLSQGITQGLLIKRVAPKYPSAALSSHIEGAVQIEATIDKEGMVTSPKVIKGDRILATAALDAVRQWRYKPYYLDGQPVEVQTEITINFKAD